MKAEVEKGCSVLTKKGFAHEGAILQEKDFSSPEVFKNLCEKSAKVKILEEPEPEVIEEPKSAESETVEEAKPDELEEKKEPVKKKTGRPKGATKKSDK